ERFLGYTNDVASLPQATFPHRSKEPDRLSNVSHTYSKDRAARALGCCRYMQYRTRAATHLSGMGLANDRLGFTEAFMSLVRLLGFTTLACGCIVGKYRELATS